MSIFIYTLLCGNLLGVILMTLIYILESNSINLFVKRLKNTTFRIEYIQDICVISWYGVVYIIHLGVQLISESSCFVYYVLKYKTMNKKIIIPHYFEYKYIEVKHRCWHKGVIYYTRYNKVRERFIRRYAK